MMDLAQLRAYDSGEILHRYTAKDSILYALGIGVGAASIDDHALTYLFEPGMQVLPTLASVLATAGNWMQDRPELGIRWQQALHGSERVIVHRPLRAAGALLGRTLVLGVAEKAPKKVPWWPWRRPCMMRIPANCWPPASASCFCVATAALLLRSSPAMRFRG